MNEMTDIGDVRGVSDMTDITDNDERTAKDKKLRVPPNESYLSNANLDYLARINMELLSELWITRDRLAIMEELLIEQGILERSAVDTFNPDEKFSNHLEKLRSVVVNNVIAAPFKHEHTVESLVAEGEKLAQLSNT